VSIQRHEDGAFASDFGDLYRDLAPPLLRYAEGILGSRSDAEEAVQDAFLAASRSGPLDGPRPWLFRATRNAAIDQLRRRRHLTLLDSDHDSASDGSSASTAGDPHRQAELSADLHLLRVGLDRLGEQQRSALVLRELSGLGYREIASVLDVSEANVKVLIFRARQSLQQFALAARLPCDAAQLALSARADGEAGRMEAARARLHTASCPHCRDFAAAVRGQRVGLVMLVPLVGAHGVTASALHAVVGAKAGGGLGGLFGLKAAAATAAAVVVVSTGAVVAVHEGVGAPHGGHGHRPPAAARRPAVVPVNGSQPSAQTEDHGGSGDLASGDRSGEDTRGDASGDGSSGSGSQTSDGGGDGAQGDGSSGSGSPTSDGGVTQGDGSSGSGSQTSDGGDGESSNTSSGEGGG
jgi:RNA polymerase sigma factor (sigma-70 family)